MTWRFSHSECKHTATLTGLLEAHVKKKHEKVKYVEKFVNKTLSFEFDVVKCKNDLDILFTNYL